MGAGYISKSKNGDYLLIKSVWEDGTYVELKVMGCYYKDGYSVAKRDETIVRATEFIRENYPDYTITKEAYEIYMKAKKRMRNKKKIVEVKRMKDINIDTKLRLNLYPFQKIGVAFTELTDGNCLLCDQMGLGKTCQAIAFAERRKCKTLIVCPASLKLVWKDEIKKFTRKDSYVVSSNDSITSTYQYTVINYDILEKKKEEINKEEWDLLICDEAHFLKNPKAKRTKAVHSIKDKFKYRILLTGTPILNRPVELYSLLNIVRPGEWGSFMWYAKRYCNATKGYWGWDFSGSSNEEELKEKLEPIMIRRLKEDVLDELPSKIYQEVRLEMTNSTKVKYDKILDDLRDYLIEYKGYSDRAADKAVRAEVFVRINELRQLVIEDKISALNSIIEGMNGDKIIVFSDYVTPLKKIHEAYPKSSVIFSGEQSLEERREVIQKFQTDDKIKIFLVLIKAAGVGITLTSANKVLFLSLPWVPGEMDQAIDRCHRIGQKDTVNIYPLLCGEIDEYMNEILNTKRDTINKIIGDSKIEPMTTMIDALIDKIIRR